MTPKGERTRQRLVDVAMARFERDGFAATTMRKIAEDAEVAVGLAYRYFPAKEAMVLAFYEQVATLLAEREVVGTGLGDRFADVMQAKFALLAAHHRAMGSLVGAMLDPEGPVGILSPATASVRAQTQAVLTSAVTGADGVSDLHHESLVSLAWLGHTQLLLAWVQRPEATEALLTQVGHALNAVVPFLGTPMGAMVLSSVQSALSGFEASTA